MNKTEAFKKKKDNISILQETEKHGNIELALISVSVTEFFMQR